MHRITGEMDRSDGLEAPNGKSRFSFVRDKRIVLMLMAAERS